MPVALALRRLERGDEGRDIATYALRHLEPTIAGMDAHELGLWHDLQATFNTSTSERPPDAVRVVDAIKAANRRRP